ncbi:hypothetical protein AYL99_09848 [Fonsecaea erecta]|uniref:Uncharacterized protein n=1 Tax=Fonsecaea erecta TaxID=1367422 RepID=A0A178Z8B9_9EURO|nr:hypothetical protein AYL99_09848 [Fonsecaea erecta]OAP55696.1 hypothetical protein AYL99_09848 [Fonsecaea erecta]
MSSRAAAMTAVELRDLPRQESITVLHHDKDATGGDNLRIVTETLPKSIATAFSSRWEAELPRGSKKSIGDFRNTAGDPADTVVVTGGSPAIWCDIINWMLASCQGYGFAPTPSAEFKQYSFQYFVRKYAASIGCDTLQKRAEQRMARISMEQVHSEDVRALWLVNPPDEEMRTFLVEHVAVRWWERRLKAKSAYLTLREEFPDLNERINTFLTQLKNASCESRGNKTPKHRRQGGNNKAKTDSAPNAQAKGRKDQQSNRDETQTVTLKVEVVRKATKKTPAYAKLDLASIGVTRDQFCGRRS